MLAFALACLLAVAGCSSAPAPGWTPPPPTSAPEPSASNAVSNAPDSVGAAPGSPGAQFAYKFRLTSPGGSSGFAFRDRDLSFSFRPSPNALYFQVENLQGRPVQIDWDKSQFFDATGKVGKVAHATTRWRDRYGTQALTQVNGRDRYSDYLFSMDDLLDPGASPDQQLRRPLLPEDTSAPTYSGREFGADLVFNIENQPRTYNIRFVVQGVIPR